MAYSAKMGRNQAFWRIKAVFIPILTYFHIIELRKVIIFASDFNRNFRDVSDHW